MNPWTPDDPLRFMESGLRHLSEDDVSYALGTGHLMSLPISDWHGADAVEALGCTPKGVPVLVLYREPDGDAPYLVWHAAKIPQSELKRFFGY